MIQKSQVYCFVVLLAVLAIIWFFFKTNEVVIQKVAAAESVQLLPELKRICSCESSYSGRADDEPQQFNPDGSLRVGKWSPHDYGMCQLSETYWGNYAKKLGLDITTEQGNIILANVLFTEHGAMPWKASYKCHKNDLR